MLTSSSAMLNSCALEQLAADAVADGLALRDELGGVELRDDGLEDFVADRGEHALVVVGAEVLRATDDDVSQPLAAAGETFLFDAKPRKGKNPGPGRLSYLVDLGQVLDLWPVQHAQGERDHLQVL